MADLVSKKPCFLCQDNLLTLEQNSQVVALNPAIQLTKWESDRPKMGPLSLVKGGAGPNFLTCHIKYYQMPFLRHNRNALPYSRLSQGLH